MNAALRGRMDPIYRELSDHWSSIFQKMWPVWVLIAPGIADPAHIQLRSATVMLNSDQLLGSRQEVLDGQLEQDRILATFGAGGHEVFHGRHSKVWISEDNGTIAETDATLADDRELLEEIRMEAHGIRDFPSDSRRGRFLKTAIQAVVAQQILPRFERRITSQLAGQVTRDIAGRSLVYLKGRQIIGTVTQPTLEPLDPIWRQVLGDQDIAALDDLFRWLIWCPDGDSDQLTVFARKYREIIGAPDQQEADGGGQPASSDTPQPADKRPADGNAADSPASAEHSQAAFEHAMREVTQRARNAARNQAADDKDVKVQARRMQAQPGRQTRQQTHTAAGTPSGKKPKRGVNRPPFGDERAAAQRFAQQMRRACASSRHTISKRTPGGRLVMRRVVRGLAERRAGLPPTAAPWDIELTRRRGLEEPHGVLAVDTSFSMSAYEEELGPITWELNEGYRLIGGRLAVVLFGDGMAVLNDGRRAMPNVPGIKVAGGTGLAGDAFVAGCQQLDMENRWRPRSLFCVSDGGWSDTRESLAKMRHLRTFGVPTLHIAIKRAPLSVEADQVIIVDNPLEAMHVVASHSVALLNAQARSRGRALATA
jgi:hypothetical protein